MRVLEPELQKLLDLSRAGQAHPDVTLYAGLPAVNHNAVLAALSPNRTEAKRLHRTCVWSGLISPPVVTSRNGRSIRVQFLYTRLIADAVNGGGSDE
jgi:hypothetical protein